VAKPGAAKVLCVHAPPIGPSWTDDKLHLGKLVFPDSEEQPGSGHPYKIIYEDGHSQIWFGHSVFAVNPKDGPFGQGANYGSLQKHRDRLIRELRKAHPGTAEGRRACPAGVIRPHSSQWLVRGSCRRRRPARLGVSRPVAYPARASLGGGRRQSTRRGAHARRNSGASLLSIVNCQSSIVNCQLSLSREKALSPDPLLAYALNGEPSPATRASHSAG